MSGIGAFGAAMFGIGVIAGGLLGIGIAGSHTSEAMEDCRRTYNVYACELKPSEPAQPVEEK